MLISSRTALSMFSQTEKPPVSGLPIEIDRRRMRQLPDRRAKYEQALAVVMRIHQMAGLRSIPLPLASRGTTSSHAQGDTADLPAPEGYIWSLTSISQPVSKVAAPSNPINLSSPSSISILDQIGRTSALTPPTTVSPRADLRVMRDRSPPYTDLRPPVVRNDDVTSSSSSNYMNASSGGDPASKTSSILGRLPTQEDLKLSRPAREDDGSLPDIIPPGGFRASAPDKASATGYSHLLDAIAFPPGSGALVTLKARSTSSSPLLAMPMSDVLKNDVRDFSPSRQSTNSDILPAAPRPVRGDISKMSGDPEARSRLARPRQTVALEPSREQGIFGRSGAASPMPTLSSPDAHAGPREAVTASQVINLTGSLLVDGRRLGQITASNQARDISLPPRGPSRVNLRAVPIYSGVQIPS